MSVKYFNGEKIRLPASGRVLGMFRRLPCATANITRTADIAEQKRRDKPNAGPKNHASFRGGAHLLNASERIPNFFHLVKTGLTFFKKNEGEKFLRKIFFRTVFRSFSGLFRESRGSAKTNF